MHNSRPILASIKTALCPSHHQPLSVRLIQGNDVMCCVLVPGRHLPMLFSAHIFGILFRERKTDRQTVIE